MGQEASTAVVKQSEEERVEQEVQRKLLRLYQVPHSELTIIRTLQKSAKSIVQQVEWRGDQLAAKTITHSQEIWDSLEIRPHSRILRFRGVVTAPDQMLLTDFKPLGDLQTEMSWKSRLRILWDVALAMDHISKEGYIYRDLAMRNVLLETDSAGELRAIIADLGWICKKQDVGLHKTRITSAPWRIMAPEVTFVEGGDSIFSEASDVWAFGVLIYCLFARKRPYAEIDQPEGVRVAISKGTRLKLKVSQLLSDPEPTDAQTAQAKSIRALFKSTQRATPSERPTFDSIIATVSAAYAGLD